MTKISVLDTVRKETFEDYLQDQCTKEGGYDGVLDDDYEVAFDTWLETKDVNDLIDYADQAIQLIKEGKRLDDIPF